MTATAVELCRCKHHFDQHHYDHKTGGETCDGLGRDGDGREVPCGCTKYNTYAEPMTPKEAAHFIRHFVALEIDPDFREELLAAAGEDRTLAQQLLIFAKAGALCSRTHLRPKTSDMERRKRK